MRKITLSLFLLALVFAARVQNTAQTQTANPSIAQSPEAIEANQLNAQIVKLYKEGKYDEALPLAKRVVELRAKALGEDNHLTVSALKNLAVIYRSKNKYGEVLAIYERLLSIAEKNKTPDEIGVANALADLATTEFAAGNLSKAEPLFQREVVIREKNIDQKPWEAMRAYTFLARLEQAAVQYDKAEANYVRAVEIAEKTPGKIPEDIVPVIEGHACLAYTNLRDNRAAHALQGRIYRILSDSKDKPISAGNENKASYDPATGAGVLNGRAISKPAPDYPAEAKRAGAMGTVVIYITVDKTGKVVAARAVCGAALLRKAALEAARQARFTPTLLNGQPVKVSGTITYNFVLQ